MHMTEFQQAKLRRYLLARDRLQRKCEEANRWQSIRAELTALRGVHPGGRSRPGGGQDALLELRDELERAALETRELRRELQEALAQMPDGDLRGLLEERYLVGRSNSPSAVCGAAWVRPCDVWSSAAHFFRKSLDIRINTYYNRNMR